MTKGIRWDQFDHNRPRLDKRMQNDLREIDEFANMGIILSDGCRLSARVWVPKDANEKPVPVILEYLPYRKRDGTCARDALTHPYFAKRGYAAVRVDMRGNGDSQGIMTDEYSEAELSDGVEVINWLAAQPWCNGNVGIMGISWGGFNGLQIAERAPAPLKAVITLCSTVDRYADDIHYKGGCLLNENMGWGATMWSYSSRPPDPALVGDAWRDMWLERLREEPFLPADWLEHQQRNDYWKHGSVCENYAGIKAAVLAIGGWGDAYKNTVSHLVENISAPVKGIVGPWVHKYPHFAVPEPKIGFLQEALRWWDHWLKGIDTGVLDDPAYTAYLMDGVRPKTWYTERPGRWLGYDSWPSNNPEETLFFTADHRLGPEAEQFEHIVCSPQDCGLDGGEYCAIWLGPEMPGDQRRDDALSICYESAPLDQPMNIIGAPEIDITLKHSAPSGQIAVRLNHIHADGASTRITYGVFNLAHRNGHDRVSTINPEEAMKIRFSLDHIAYRVPAGDRIRISISNAYWPLLWPMPQAGDSVIIAGSCTISLATEGIGDQRVFPSPEMDQAWKVQTLRPSNNTRRIDRDLKTGIVTTEIIDDFGSVRDEDHGLISGSIAREWWSIHPDDPLSARAKIHWTQENARDAWSVRTETFSEMWSDVENFYLTARLEAYEGESLVFSKDVERTIPREGH